MRDHTHILNPGENYIKERTSGASSTRKNGGDYKSTLLPSNRTVNWNDSLQEAAARTPIVRSSEATGGEGGVAYVNGWWDDKSQMFRYKGLGADGKLESTPTKKKRARSQSVGRGQGSTRRQPAKKAKTPSSRQMARAMRVLTKKSRSSSKRKRERPNSTSKVGVKVGMDSSAGKEALSRKLKLSFDAEASNPDSRTDEKPVLPADTSDNSAGKSTFAGKRRVSKKWYIEQEKWIIDNVGKFQSGRLQRIRLQDMIDAGKRLDVWSPDHDYAAIQRRVSKIKAWGWKPTLKG